jgi:hypothetical protein
MSTEEKEGKARNEEIENQLKRDRMQQRNEIKMLLLGKFHWRRQVARSWVALYAGCLGRRASVTIEC